MYLTSVVQCSRFAVSQLLRVKSPCMDTRRSSYVRTTCLLKPNKGDEFTQTLENEILPLLRKQNGFEDEITLASREGKKAVAISLWDRKESADAYSRETYPQVLKSLAKVVDGTPEVQAYEIVNSSFHKTAAHS